MDVQDAGNGLSGKPRLAFSRPILAALLAWPLIMSLSQSDNISAYYFLSHDRYLLFLLVMVMFALTFRVPRWVVPDLAVRGWPLAAGLFGLALALWWGTYGLMANYALTRDEHMVLFDMAIFAKGQLLEPLDAIWRANPKALVPDFLMVVPGNQALISGYLPGNAMLRLAFSRIADPALMNPLLVMVSGLALLDIARRMFGEDRRAVLVTMVLFLGSAQLLVTAMTVYAMTWHTVLNLVWLALFLRGTRLGHAGAMLAGFVAMGLHQVVFHPLFAAPFLLWLLQQRRFTLCSAYTAFYVLAGLFWISYPALAFDAAGIVASDGTGNGASFLRDRVLPLLMERNPATIGLMSLNLFRFVLWNHLALLPLVITAWPVIRRNYGLAAPLAGGIVLTFAVMTVLLPAQGHGWGYRYFAGLLGSFALLGGMGYRCWIERDRASADGTFMALSALTVLFMAADIASAQRFVAPYAALDRFIAGSNADMALIDTEKPSVAIDLVRNEPDLSNRPLRLSSKALSASEIAGLCDRGTIAPITRGDMHRAGLDSEPMGHSPLFEAKLAKALAGRSCSRENRALPPH